MSDLNHVLTTTRSVRLRLDHERPVPIEVIGECLQLALQAPTGGAAEDWRWLVVADPALKAELARLYLDAYTEYVEKPLRAGPDHPTVKGRLGGPGTERTARILRGARHLAHTIGRAPYLVIPCATRPNPDAGGPGTNSALYGSVYPAIWQFNLALRARGLGTCITTLHLHHAAEVARLLSVPDHAVQITMLPVAYTVGSQFRPAVRKPVSEVAFLDTWDAPLPYEEKPWNP